MAQSTHHNDYRLFLAVLKTARERAKITQVDLAQMLGTTQTFVSKFERGERRLDIVEFVEICEALKVDPKFLLSAYLSSRKQTEQNVKKLSTRKST